MKDGKMGCQVLEEKKSHVSSITDDGHWGKFISISSMETPECYNVVMGLEGELCHKTELLAQGNFVKNPKDSTKLS